MMAWLGRVVFRHPRCIRSILCDFSSGMKAVVLLSFTLITLAHADLKWDQREQTFTVKSSDRTLVAKYRFTNSGAKPVTIEGVRTSCGCTTASLAKKEYQPGESGEIEAHFELSGRVGHQEKAILVTTTDAPESPTVLRLIVDIPQMIKIEPEVVYWHVGEAPEPKTIDVSVAADSPANIVSVVTDTPEIKAMVKENLPGKKAIILVTPANTARAEAATLVIKTDYPADNPEAHYAYVRIK